MHNKFDCICNFSQSDFFTKKKSLERFFFFLLSIKNFSSLPLKEVHPDQFIHCIYIQFTDLISNFIHCSYFCFCTYEQYIFLSCFSFLLFNNPYKWKYILLTKFDKQRSNTNILMSCNHNKNNKKKMLKSFWLEFICLRCVCVIVVWECGTVWMSTVVM